ncbi:MAG: hypothetical protein H0T79_11330 [Deltaproteobacteria bacterium]|nr:hypothetical protein [Deltaproteobacteria bacterium]
MHPPRALIGLLVRLAILVAIAACSGKASPIAELTKADGPIDRQVGTAEWKGAAIGAGFFLGDAARTADGGAQLTIKAGAAQIAMQPRTILRFGGTQGASRIAVELGAIDLTGTGSYALDIGDVKLSRGGSVRVTSRGQGQSSLELTGGEAQITANGQTLDLAIGKQLELSLEAPKVTVDAGVPADAPVLVDAAEPPDAAVPVSSESTVEVTGKKAEVLEPGEKVWKPMAAGAGQLAKGAKLRVGAGSTATVTSGGATLEIGNGARIEIGSDLAMYLEAGGGKATVPAGSQARIKFPGGGLGLKGGAQSVGRAQIEIGAKTKITIVQGTGKLTGASGAELDMNRGESATIARSGQIHVLEAIPTYFDFRTPVGETLTLHDPKGATAVQFQFSGKCPNGGVIELDKDTRFRSSKISAGKDSANLMVSGGGWAYRLRCTTAGGDEGAAVASGRIAVLRDDGRRALPKGQTSNDIDADGRNYRISYQSVIPNLIVRYMGVGGSAFKLHLATGGKSESFDGGPKITVPGSKLREGTYTYWFERDGVKEAKVSTLKIDFDQTAPQVYIEAPSNGQVWVGDIEVRGAVLVGWTAAVDSITIPIDSQRRFAAKVAPPSSGALAIKLSHPQRGVHYYLRRGK